MLATKNKQGGAGLIEVLITMIIVTVGILGTLSMQNRSVHFNRGSMLQARASILAADIVDRIRTNPSQASNYRIGLNDSLANFTDCENPQASCSVQQLAAFDIGTWRQEISTALPDGKGEVMEVPGPGGMSIFVITVQYQDALAEQGSAFSQSGNGVIAPKQIVLRTSI